MLPKTVCHILIVTFLCTVTGRKAGTHKQGKADRMTAIFIDTQTGGTKPLPEIIAGA